MLYVHVEFYLNTLSECPSPKLGHWSISCCERYEKCLNQAFEFTFQNHIHNNGFHRLLRWNKPTSVVRCNRFVFAFFCAHSIAKTPSALREMCLQPVQPCTCNIAQIIRISCVCLCQKTPFVCSAGGFPHSVTLAAHSHGWKYYT